MIRVTFNETNPKTLEVEVIDCEGILEKINLEENDQEAEQSQSQSQNQIIDEESIRDQIIYTPSDPQNLPKEWRVTKPIRNVIGDISKGVTIR